MNQSSLYDRPHFHIRWKKKSTLDWECFPSHAEAETRAAELAEPDEVFTIEEVSSECPMRGAEDLPRRANSQISS